jgi:hypothetical protein
MTPTREAVFESLNNAIINAPEIVGYTAIALANDLVTYDPVHEDFSEDQVLAFVEEWLNEKKGKLP